jgi:hypothetical protein
VDPVKREEHERQECPLKSFGSEDKESSEDSLENIELLKKSTELSITDFTLLLKEINSKTKLS